MNNLANILTVARREFTVRVRTRSYQLGSAVLILGVLAFAFLPVIGRLLEGNQSQRIALHVTAANMPSDPAATLTAMLNSSAAQATPAGTRKRKRPRRDQKRLIACGDARKYLLSTRSR